MTMTIVYHPPLDGPTWPGLDPPAPASLLWLAVALAMALFGLAFGLLASTVAGVSMAPIALPAAVGGLIIALNTAINEVHPWNTERGI